MKQAQRDRMSQIDPGPVLTCFFALFGRILLMVVARQLGANDLPEIYSAFKAAQLLKSNKALTS